MTPRRIVPGVWHLPEPGVNLYYLESEGILVDTGLPFFLEEVLEALAHLPIRLVVLTHADFDHAGGVGALARALVPVAAHADEKEILESEGTGLRRLITRLRPPVRVTRVLADGDRLGDFTVLATPGHSRGHISLFRDDGVLIAGDACGVRGGRVVRPIHNVDDRKAARSLARLATLPVTYLLAGHGPPAAVGPADLIAALW